MRSLTLAKRRELLCLTASSGSVANLQLLLPLVGCGPTSEALAAAAKAGRLHVCDLLLQHGSSWDRQVMEAAGESGSWQVCEWAMAGGCPGGASAAMRGAARAGHVGLLDRLLAAHGPPGEAAVEGVLAGVAEGCDLASLQRLHAEWLGGEEDRAGLLAWLARFASSSPTPDWRAKVEWLEAAGCSRELLDSPARCPDAVDRLEWLTGRGWPLDRRAAVLFASRRGSLACLEFLQPLQKQEQQAATGSLARGGHLRALQALRARGWALDPHLAAYAAQGGHLHVVAWAVEVLGEEVLTARLFKDAVTAGNLQLLAWLRGRGCPWEPSGCWHPMVDSGCEEALEWLAAYDPPPQDQCVRNFLTGNAACAGDLATLACLRRLGCVWTQDGATFTDVIRWGGQLPVLRWLVEQGCPVDWGAAIGAAGHGTGAAAVTWMKQQSAARRRTAEAAALAGQLQRMAA